MRRDDSGATAVEFSLVVPLFFVLIGAAGYFAWQLYTQSQLERAAQAAARYAAVPMNDGTYAFRHCDIVTDVNHNLTVTHVKSNDVSVNDASGTLPPAACPGGPAASKPAQYVHVTVTHQLDNPFSNLLTFMLQRPKPLTITGNGDARVEDPT